MSTCIPKPANPPLFFLPTHQPEDWASGLADRSQWAASKSAYELAHAWELARGIPPRVRTCLANGSSGVLADIVPLVGLPEHPVDLGDGLRASQTDLLVLARSENAGYVVLAVEGKESEPFGNDTVDVWLTRTKTGENRLGLVCEAIGLDPNQVGHVYYQLLHRAAAAVLEARRFGAKHAVILVHSFSAERKHLSAYQEFLALYGVRGGDGELVELRSVGDLLLHAGWVSDDKQALRGPYGGAEIADDAIAWLRGHYCDQTFFCERDVEAVLQRRITDLISEQGLAGLRVRRNRHLHGLSRAKQVDLSVERADGTVELAMEVKYEPAPLRPDLARLDGTRPEPVTFWTEIREEVDAMRDLSADGTAAVAVTLLIDEGARLSIDSTPADCSWTTWDDVTRGAPGWLSPRVMESRFVAPAAG